MSQPEPIIIVPENPGSETVQVRVLRVFDGDGFMAQITDIDPSEQAVALIGARIPVRLGFIDAPEIDQPGGPEARAFLIRLIAGATLDLAVLFKMDTGRSVDRHGRIVCVPYLAQEYDTIDCLTASQTVHRVHRFGGSQRIHRNIELEMVINGWAWVLDRYGPDERYGMALAEARRHRRGIWASDDNVAPWEAKRQRHRAQRGAASPLRVRERQDPPPTLFSF